MAHKIDWATIGRLGASSGDIKIGDIMIEWGVSTVQTGDTVNNNGYPHYSGETTVNFPTPFAALPMVAVASTNSATTSPSDVYVVPNAAGSMLLRFISASAGYSRTVYWLAIGRWK